jgi:hypothetical protein
VTRRAWILLALGVVAAVMTAGAFARAGQSDFKPSKPQPGWGVFTAAQWKTLSLRVGRRGFAPGSVRIVTAMDTTGHRPFALVAGTTLTGATCIIPVTGMTLGLTVCRLSKPLVVFTAPNNWRDAAVPGIPAHVVHAVSVIGIARHDVSGVVARDGSGIAQGLPVIESGRLRTFAGGFRSLASLRAFDAKNHTLARLVLRAP